MLKYSMAIQNCHIVDSIVADQNELWTVPPSAMGAVVDTFKTSDDDVLHPNLTVVRVFPRNSVQFGVGHSTALCKVRLRWSIMGYRNRYGCYLCTVLTLVDEHHSRTVGRMLIR